MSQNTISQVGVGTRIELKLEGEERTEAITKLAADLNMICDDLINMSAPFDYVNVEVHVRYPTDEHPDQAVQIDDDAEPSYGIQVVPIDTDGDMLALADMLEQMFGLPAGSLDRTGLIGDEPDDEGFPEDDGSDPLTEGDTEADTQ